MVALDNFHSFAYMQTKTIDVEILKLLERKEAQTELEEQKQLRIHELNQQACAHVKRKDAVKQLQMKIEQQKAAIFQMQQEKSGVVRKLEKIRTEKYDEDYNLEMVEKTCVTLDREIAELQKQVVQSPAQLALQLKDEHSKLEASREDLVHKETALRVKKEQLASYQQIVDKPQVCHAHLKALIPLYTQIPERATSLRKMQEKQKMFEEQRITKLEENEKHIRLLEDEREQYDRMVADWKRKNEGLGQQLADVKLEVEEGEKRQRKEDHQLSSLQAEAVQLRILEEEKYQRFMKRVEAFNQEDEKLKEWIKEFNKNAEEYLKKDIKQLEELEGNEE